jgi:molybdopterin/thiamine biosynthesis adenylyltransferase
MTVLPGRTACYRCIFHELPADEEASPQGPLGALPGVIGSVQAIEAIKFLLDIGTPLTNVLLTFDALAMSFRKVPVRPDPHCPLCGTAAF